MHNHYVQHRRDLVRLSPPAILVKRTRPYRCVACDGKISLGEYVVYMPLGPGLNQDKRKAARAGKWYAAEAVEIHYSCATGYELSDGLVIR